MDTFGGSPYYLLCGFNSFKNTLVKYASFPSKNLNSSRNHHAFTFPETNIESEKYAIAKRKPWSSMPLIFRCCMSFKDSETLHIPERTNMEPSQAGLESSCFFLFQNISGFSCLCHQKQRLRVRGCQLHKELTLEKKPEENYLSPCLGTKLQTLVTFHTDWWIAYRWIYFPFSFEL